MSDLYMFTNNETIEQVKKATEMYENNRGQQDIFY